MTEKIIIDFFQTYSREIISFTWKLLPVILGSEFIARLIMSWYKVRSRKVDPKYFNDLGRAIGLTMNGVMAALWVLPMVSDHNWVWYVNTVPFYAGFTMAIHWLISRKINKKKDK